MELCLAVRPRAGPARCAVCHDELTGPTEVCERCQTASHTDCRAALARCPTLACLPRTAAAERLRRRPAWEGRSWDLHLELLLIPTLLGGLVVAWAVYRARLDATFHRAADRIHQDISGLGIK